MSGTSESKGMALADVPDSRTLRNRVSARLFGGASGGVFRGMATLALGSGIGRVIGIAAIPILTRLYSPEDFGVLAVFTALVAILAPLVTLRYVLALPLPRHDGVAMNLLAISVGLMLVLSAVVALALWLGGEALLGLVSMQVLAPWWWLIALGVLGTATYEMLTLWATRKRAYKVIAQTKVTQSAAGAVIKIALGLASLQPLGLLVGQVVAQAGGIGRLMRGFLSEFRASWRHVSRSRMRKAARRHRGFPIWRVPSQFLMVFSVQAPMLFIAALYDPQTTGQFGLAVMALSVPINLLGRTTSQAFFAEASLLGARRSSEIRTMLKSVMFRLGAVSVLPALVLLVFGEPLFAFLFGGEWVQAGLFAQALAIYLFFQFIQAPVAHVFNIFDGHRQLLFLNVQRVALIAAVFGMSHGLSWTSEFAVWAYALTLSLHYALSAVYAYRFIPIRSRGR
ncbi:oligosaccharide flippase family protein [Maritimibacter sp. HL-12]|uniref:oligosaccharide flippase family protein n=1 Tax=Maritimibacter sp. HL-12 TaxID=1162418 RepID=UPI000A0F1875|nr:oligosaccharide flippase family protein [Maritimibacter sp. HL-12]SMH56151.1 Membrane protein involved in the export of O-antigen and teichoic acid [Maritimibacter sp. HL-12]